MTPPSFPALASAERIEGDPLGRFRDGVVAGRNGRPIPLVATRIKVLVAGGLAVVRTERVFRNAEVATIEATLTFPVPVQATLFGLAARIGDRLLRAIAQARGEARATYEAAVDRGRTAVLHEEAMRGIHIVSLTHLPPGAEVTVASDWAMSLTAAPNGAATLRIPTTVGELYGRTPLADSDDLLTDTAMVQTAEFEIQGAEGVVSLASGAALIDGRGTLRLDRPIDIRIEAVVPRVLQGVTAGGLGIALQIAPARTGEAAINAVVLVDHSGSMGDAVGVGGASKHQAVVAGLRAAATTLRPDDHLRLWEFNDNARPVQAHFGPGVQGAIDALSPPQGGTNTGGAIKALLAAETAGDIVLVTDGQSWALDVQAAARSGRRFTVVLIGEDSLEANVGHLAALSGGQIFVAGSDVADAVRLALATLRQPHHRAAPVEERPVEVEAQIAGMRVVATLGAPAPAVLSDDLLPRAVAAVAAGLALPSLPEEAAAALAREEGLCCHLTSLVLVDETGAVQAGLPAQRKVPLMAPAAAMCAAPPATRNVPGVRTLFRMVEAGRMSRALEAPSSAPDGPLDIPTFLRRSAPAKQAGPGAGQAAAKVLDLGFARGRINWSVDPEALRRGNLGSLPPDIGAALSQASGIDEIIRLAEMLGEAPLAVAVALLADAEAAGNRFAARISRAVLGSKAASLVVKARKILGLWY